MARSLLKSYVKDRAGNCIQNALVYVYLQGTTTPVSDMYAAASGGSPITTLTSNAQGEVTAWFTSPKYVDLKVTDNSNAAYYAATGALVDGTEFTETVRVDCPPKRPAVTWLSETEVPLDGVTNGGALFNAAAQELENGGGGMLVVDGVGTLLAETELIIPGKVTLWTLAGDRLTYKAKAGAGLDCVMRFGEATGSDRKTEHRVGKVDVNGANGGATDGVYALASQSAFHVLTVSNATLGRAFVPAMFQISLVMPRITSSKYGIAIPAAAEFAGGVSRANEFMVDRGNINSTEADLYLEDDAQQCSGIGLHGVGFGGDKYNVYGNSPNVDGLDLIGIRSEGVSGAASRCIKLLDTNSTAFHVLGGVWSAASGSKPDYLFELEGADHVIADAMLANYNTAVVKGLAGLRRGWFGEGCQYDTSKDFLDRTLVTNKNRVGGMHYRDSQPHALFGDGTAAYPALAGAADPTTGIRFDQTNHRIYFVVQGVDRAYIDATGLH